MAIVRSIVGIVAGLLVITLIAEGIEFALVSALNGGVETDQERYFAIRNQTGVLIAKLFYNSLAAFAGGYAAARVAGRAALYHGIALAAIQTATFVWGMTLSEFAGTTPLWAWLALTVLMIAFIVLGARMQEKE